MVIVEKIIASKDEINGRTPRGFAERLLKEAQKSFPGMKMNMINYSIKKLKNKVIKSTVSFGPDETMVSDLTEVSTLIDSGN
jgi:hypothetical protein